MWRLIAFILVCALFLVFIVFNLDNKTDVSFGFRTFDEIPVFLTAFTAFVIGMLFATPFAFSFGKKRKKAAQDSPAPPEGGKQPTGLRKFWKGKSKKTPLNTDKTGRDVAGSTDQVNKENNPYEID